MVFCRELSLASYHLPQIRLHSSLLARDRSCLVFPPSLAIGKIFLGTRPRLAEIKVCRTVARGPDRARAIPNEITARRPDQARAHPSEMHARWSEHAGAFSDKILAGRSDHASALSDDLFHVAHARCSPARYGPGMSADKLPSLRPCSAEEQHGVTGEPARRPRRVSLNSLYLSYTGLKHTHLELCHIRIQKHGCDP